MSHSEEGRQNPVKRLALSVALVLLIVACGGDGQSDTARFCEIHTEFDVFAQADIGQFTPKELQEFMTAGVDLVDEAAEVAPAELGAEADRSAVGFHAALELYAETNFDLTQLDPDAAGAYLEEHGAEMEAATGAIDKWAEEHC
jgi:hypothetical protein